MNPETSPQRARAVAGTYLLDVNALIAAIWTDHVNHSLADSWIEGKALATCPLSDLGFLRISTSVKALGASMADARALLQDFLSKHRVRVVAADLPALDSHPSKSEEVTDQYLADLAASKSMKMATLDTRIVHASVEVIK
jgi:uncharacterized protein